MLRKSYILFICKNLETLAHTYLFCKQQGSLFDGNLRQKPDTSMGWKWGWSGSSCSNRVSEPGLFSPSLLSLSQGISKPFCTIPRTVVFNFGCILEPPEQLKKPQTLKSHPSNCTSKLILWPPSLLSILFLKVFKTQMGKLSTIYWQYLLVNPTTDTVAFGDICMYF